MATKTWSGGTGTWDSTNGTNWTGGTAPVNGDAIVFDGTSGGGVVTVAANVSGQSFASITTSAFTGTLDFSVNNPSLTITGTWTDAATGVHTINLGSGTFTFSGSNGNLTNFTTSANLTLSAASSTLVFSASAINTRTFVSAGKTYGTVTVVNSSSSCGAPFVITAAPSIGTLNLTAPVNLSSNNSTGPTITTAFNATGTSANPILLESGNTSTQSWTVPAGTTVSWCSLRNITFVTNSPTCNNSLDLRGNVNATINPPSSGGGGGFVIGS